MLGREALIKIWTEIYSLTNVSRNIDCVHGGCRWLVLRIMKPQLEVAPWHSLNEDLNEVWNPMNDA